MDHEATIRLAIFTALFATIAAWEALMPRRRRWTTNVAITVIDTLTLRAHAVALPLLAVGAALDAGRHGRGLFNRLGAPGWAEALATVLILDIAIWALHPGTHRVPVPWRFHRIHHADRDIDGTTAGRFHPVGIAASMVLRIGIVYLLGAPALAVLIFEILLNGTALFNHANIALPPPVDRVLRLVPVTPDMHRVHHSTRRHAHHSNCGFARPIRDRAFGTYAAEPEGGHMGMGMGSGPEWQDERPALLGWCLMLPFRRR